MKKPWPDPYSHPSSQTFTTSQGETMSDVARYKPNPTHIFLEIVGSILAGAGLAETYANTNLVPIQWQFENYGWHMVAIGFLLGLPHLLGLLKHAKSSNKNANTSAPNSH